MNISGVAPAVELVVVPVAVLVAVLAAVDVDAVRPFAFLKTII